MMRRLPVLPLLLPLLLLVACAPAARTASETFASTIVGEYAVTLSRPVLSTAAAAAGRDVEGMDLAGTWEVEFHDSNHLVAFQNGVMVYQSPYRIAGSRIEFPADDAGPAACRTPATYAWQRSGDQLRFTLVGEDACYGRTLVLTARPFTRRP